MAMAKARPNESIGGLPVASAAGDHVFRLLLRLASRSRHDRRWDEAVAGLESAAGYARSDPERLESRLLLADILLDAVRPRDAVSVLEQLLLDERLRTLPVAAADGRRTIRADLLIADRLSAIVRDHGREVYAAFDRQAAELFQRGRNQHDAHVLAEVCRDFPLARVVPEALFELGMLSESTGRLAEASQAYKRLQTLAPDDQRRALAIWSLARVYDARKLYVSARDAYLDLLARYPNLQLLPVDPSATVAELVKARLSREPYIHLVADRPQPPIPQPLVRRWQWQAPDNRPIRAIGADGAVPTLDASHVVLGQRDHLRLLDPSDGRTRWSSPLGFHAVWAGYLADKLIAAGPNQIAALELNQGTVQWRFDLARLGKGPSRPDPFAPPKDPDQRQANTGQTLHDFRVVKGRVFCLRGPSELIALDGDTGALDWSFSAPPAEINPNLWIGADRVLLQLDHPNQLLVLRTEDGQPVTRSPLGEKEVLERPPLPLDDDSVLLVTDPRTVRKYDVNQGQTIWEYRESEDLPVNGPPYLLGDADRVLVVHDGRTLIRLDPATGSKRWSCLLGLEDLSKRPGSLAFDEQRFYCIYRWSSTVTLRAVSLADGTPVWTRHWTGPENADWSIALAADHVLAYPDDSGRHEPAEVENLPVIVRRRATGSLVQRFVFPATVANVRLKIDPGGALLATPRGVWGLGAREK
jgi:outer membrane protein assembly factor BamB